MKARVPAGLITQQPPPPEPHPFVRIQFDSGGMVTLPNAGGSLACVPDDIGATVWFQGSSLPGMHFVRRTPRGPAEGVFMRGPGTPVTLLGLPASPWICCLRESAQT